MKRQYGLMLAMLFAAGQLVAAEQAGDDMQKMPNMPMNQSEQTADAMDENETAHEGAMAQSGFSSGSVMRSAFSTRINDREPVDDIDKLENETREVYYFTELRDMEGQTAKHRWEYQGEVMAEVEFDVKGPRWRVWSSKRFVPDWTGDWSVSVVNAAGEVIARDSLDYVEAQQESNSSMGSEHMDSDPMSSDDMSADPMSSEQQ